MALTPMPLDKELTLMINCISALQLKEGRPSAKKGEASFLGMQPGKNGQAMTGGHWAKTYLIDATGKPKLRYAKGGREHVEPVSSRGCSQERALLDIYRQLASANFLKQPRNELPEECKKLKVAEFMFIDRNAVTQGEAKKTTH